MGELQNRDCPNSSDQVRATNYRQNRVVTSNEFLLSLFVFDTFLLQKGMSFGYKMLPVAISYLNNRIAFSTVCKYFDTPSRFRKDLTFLFYKHNFINCWRPLKKVRHVFSNYECWSFDFSTHSSSLQSYFEQPPIPEL